MVYVTWDDAQTFCTWTGGRLPTEAEWEKAARGSLESEPFPWGDEPANCTRANFYYDDYCLGDTSSVGSYAPNGYGLYDMAGNVWEWTQSTYAEYPYDPTDGREDLESTDSRVLRGGSWPSGVSGLRVAIRFFNPPSFTDNYLGFRCARSP